MTQAQTVLSASVPCQGELGVWETVFNQTAIYNIFCILCIKCGSNSAMLIRTCVGWGVYNESWQMGDFHQGGNYLLPHGNLSKGFKGWDSI